MATTYIKGFPQSSDEMEQWMKKYKFDPAATTYGQKGAWYDPTTQVSATPTTPTPTQPAPIVPTPTPISTTPTTPVTPVAPTLITPTLTPMEDFLTSGTGVIAQLGDKAARAKVAAQYGMSNYTGTLDQDVELYSLIKKAQTAAQQPTTQPQGQTYTVQSGDTLSAIAQKMGTTINQITGYKSGDPNLIYPGEVLTIGGGMGQQLAQTGVAEQPDATGGDIPAQIQNVQAQITELQQQLGYAEQAGYGEGGQYAGQNIPADILAGKGIVIDPNTAITNPTASWQTTYQDLFTQLGLDTVKTQINENIAKIQALDDELAEKVNDVNMNPWISEGLRAKQVNALNEKYADKKQGLVSALTLYQNTYNDGRQEAQFLVTTALQQYNADRTFDMNEQKMLADQAEATTQAKLDLLKVDPARYKSVQNGIYDIQEGEWIVQPKEDVTEYKPPTSYQEWELAGKPGTYADWLTTQSVKAPTSAQQTVAEYAARIEQSEPTLTSLEEYITGMNVANFTAQVALPAAFQSSEIQQYMQAARNFINAKLRRESGAVISPTEFSEARQQYLPQPGDKPETLKLKADNRRLVLESLKKAAGTAYSSVEELIGGIDDTDLTDDEAYKLYLKEQK